MSERLDDQLSKEGCSWLSPVRIALIYLLLSVLWIFFSDRFLVAIGVDNVHYWQTLKGWGFVTVTALLIYFLTHRLTASLKNALHKERLAHNAYRQKSDELTTLNNELEERVKSEVAKQRQNEQLLIEQARLLALGETLRHVAHHWRQPLTRIALGVQDVEDAYRHGELNEAYLRHTTQKTMEAVEGLSHTIDSFIRFFPTTDGVQNINLADQTKGALAIVKGVLEGSQIEASFDTDDTGLMVEGYLGAFNQVLVGILSNACEAIERARDKHHLQSSQGQIRITLQRDAQNATLKIFNTGTPIPDEHLPKLFDPYFTTKNMASGTGVSLYAAKIIIEKHMGGHLSAQNHTDGVSFVITLPLSIC